MKRNELEYYINNGREIEFVHDVHRYSITYSCEGEEDYIPFCEFYKETSDAKSIEELIEVRRYGITVMQMLAEISEENIWIY